MGCLPSGNMKSQSTFYIDLLSKVFLDSTSLGGETPLSVQRDIALVRRRVECEGMSFLTKTLPTFGKAVLKSIEDGHFTPSLAFRKASKKSLLPAFLSGWTKRIFLPNGLLSPVCDPYVLSELMQICMLFYKLELPYTSRQESAVVTSFEQTENELADCAKALSVSDSVLTLARDLLRGVLHGIEFRDIKPKHGPGSVATGETGNGKWRFRRKYQRLHQEFPYYRYFSPSLSMVSLESGWYGRLVPELNSHAKVVLVPKDSRGPRLISMEPLEVQWIQQGLAAKLVNRIESHPLTRGKINFTNQSLNQQAALESSLDCSLATLDLKEASDRISLDLVRQLFPEEACRVFESCRSVATVLPDGKLLALKKFAPMGSALCFPVLALTIWALTEAALRLSNLDTGRILVYGDDLIIPTESYALVTETLTSAKLAINHDKSYHRSSYRESCGVDAYAGVAVTPIRYRRVFSGSHRDHSLYAHLCELSESFFNKGYWLTAQFLRKKLRSVYGNIPWTHDQSYPGHHCPDVAVCKSRNLAMGIPYRWNNDLQREEILVRTIVAKREKDEPSPQARLMKGLLGLYMFADEDDHVTLRKKCVLRKRWCAA